MSTPRILIIAGSDSGGGAGIQADIKTVTMLGGHAMTAITAVTAQNTLGVTDVHPVPAETVMVQIDAVVSDIGVDAVKIGMIGSPETALMVAKRLEALGDVPIVFDPVMVATSGSSLADAATVAAFGKLMDVATITTPNLPELHRLSGERDPLTGARKLQALHGPAVLIKGGHDEGQTLTDTLVEACSARSWQDPRIDTSSTHGTGCTLASAIAFFLGAGLTLTDAVERARVFVRLSLLEAPGLGAGHGPMGQQAVRLDSGLGLRLNQVTVHGTDFAAMVAFYRKLGLRQIVDSPDNQYARFEAGAATFSVHCETQAVGGDTAVYFECDDLDERVAKLIHAGFSFEQEPRDQTWLWREARLRDPAGNLVILYHAGEARRFPPWRIDG